MLELASPQTRQVELMRQRVVRAIARAEQGQTKLQQKQCDLPGMSSRKVRIFLNEMVFPDTRYLEVGVWQGATFVSALRSNRYASAVAIDDFSQFGGSQSVFVHSCLANSIRKFRCIVGDCFELTELEKESIVDCNLYFYDGSHKERLQKKALPYFVDNLAPVFVFVVDDWNLPEVKRATRKTLTETRVSVHHAWELPAKGNQDTLRWWNGLSVFVCQKQ